MKQVNFTQLILIFIVALKKILLAYLNITFSQRHRIQTKFFFNLQIRVPSYGSINYVQLLQLVIWQYFFIDMAQHCMKLF